MRYKCNFPGCTYETNHRYIHYHHIIPKSKGGPDKESNRVWLCPNHHCRIYIPGETHGIHSVCTVDSIILIAKRMSTAGLILEYRTPLRSEIMHINENIDIPSINNKEKNTKFIKSGISDSITLLPKTNYIKVYD